jgi:hypothetical protein
MAGRVACNGQGKVSGPIGEAAVRVESVRLSDLGARASRSSGRVEALEAVIRRHTDLMVGSVPAYADDVLNGLRQFVRDRMLGRCRPALAARLMAVDH